MLPKTGRIFRNGTGERAPRLVYAKAIGTALRHELGSTRFANKRVRQWTGAGERTIKNWLSGTQGPRGEYLLLLAFYSDEVFEMVLSLTARDHAIAPIKLRKIRDEMARSLRNFEELMDQPR
jgi:hypothetical protein